MSLRVLFHVQHLLGIGHQRRAAALARALAAAGCEVTLLSGGLPLPGDTGEPAGLDGRRLGGITLVQLPPARALDSGFKHIVDEAGAPIDDDFRARRRALVLDALAACRPEVVLIETFPFGRRAFRFELDPLIAAARALEPRPLVLSSIRDVLVAKPDPRRQAEIVERVERDFDAVLVHGDPAFLPLEASFPPAAGLAAKLLYTGYVSEPPAPDGGSAGRGEVIVSAGGGAVGERLLAAAIAARPQSALAQAPWRLLAGPNLPDPAYRALTAALPKGMVLERHRSDFPALLARCALSISQGGYNTILDLLRAGPRAIVVPFAAGAESEQTLRARHLARRGVIHLLDERDLDGTAASGGPARHPDAVPGAVPGAGLAAAIAAALAAPPARAAAIDLDGARRSATLVTTLAARDDRRAALLPKALNFDPAPGYT